MDYAKEATSGAPHGLHADLCFLCVPPHKEQALNQQGIKTTVITLDSKLLSELSGALWSKRLLHTLLYKHFCVGRSKGKRMHMYPPYCAGQNNNNKRIKHR